MSNIIEITTKRLLLRQWRQDDLKAFANVNSNATVMRYYSERLNDTQSNALAHSIQQRFITNSGWGFWAVEIPNKADFIGFVGLNKPEYELPFEKPVEIGWRLSDHYWHQGYATEAAQAVLDVGFEQLGFDEIVAFTSLLNLPSIKVMLRLNMINSEYLFEHPKVPVGNPLRQHCLYKITLEHWKRGRR